jgi:hypothetical protein
MDPDPDQGGPPIRIPNTGFSTVTIADENLRSSLLHSVERGSEEGEEEEEGALEYEGSSFETYEWAGQSRYSVQNSTSLLLVGGSCIIHMPATGEIFILVISDPDLRGQLIMDPVGSGSYLDTFVVFE